MNPAALLAGEPDSQCRDVSASHEYVILSVGSITALCNVVLRVTLFTQKITLSNAFLSDDKLKIFY